MNVEKRLKEEAKKVDDAILADGRQFKEALKREYCLPSETISKQSNFKKKFVVIPVCCVVLCLLVLSVCLPLLLDNKPIQYLKENEISVATTLNEIYENISLRINDENFSVSLPERVEDSVSKDTLYYSVKVDSKSVFPRGTINFVKNEHYDLLENNVSKDTSCTWNAYVVKYAVSSKDQGGLPMLQVDGCLYYGLLRVYFTYYEVDLGIQINPVDFLDSLFKV